ncbi:MAG TPA: hypothetical protein PKC72_06115 [Chitinophagaceae bacterium]|nr:hypothetical protein [Chitinophagaceae bacterium]
MLFKKEHLNGLYNWSNESEVAVFQGQASRRVFNRWHGDQVLFIINLLLQASGDLSILQGRRIERIIINELPFESGSELTVLNWLKKTMELV